MPMLPYNAEHIRLMNYQKRSLEDLYGSELRFPLPYKLQGFAGTRTAFRS